MSNPNQPPYGGGYQQSYGGGYQQPPAPQQQKGCLGRNWKWMLPVGCLGLILGLVALVGGIVFVAMSAIKSSDVYQGALKVAQTHPAAIQRLGEPIKDGWFVSGNVNYTNGSGNANFDIPVSGPKGSGTLRVRAVNPSGAWMYEKLELSVKGGETISLLDRNVVTGTRPDAEDEADDSATDDEEGEAAESASPSDGQTISAGVLDGKAVSKPQPAYPALAKTARASGVVTVQVTVDETGQVVEASAVSGHPLLRQAAIAAAKQARFAPTLRDGEPVKVTGVLTYNFVLEQ